VLGINDLITTTITGDGIEYYSAHGFPFGTIAQVDGIQHLYYWFYSEQGNTHSYIFIKSYPYTPVLTSSTILVNFDTNYAISGFQTDLMLCWLDISQNSAKYSSFTRSTNLSTVKPTTMKAFFDYNSGRGSPLLPIEGFLKQTTGATCYITIGFTCVGSDDKIAVYADNTTIMTITEVG
jgi:hypothetical protein